MKNQVVNKQKRKNTGKTEDVICISPYEGWASNITEKGQDIILKKRKNRTSLVKKVNFKAIEKSKEAIKRANGTFSLKKREEYEAVLKGPKDAYFCPNCRRTCSLTIGPHCLDCNKYIGIRDESKLNNLYVNLDITDDDLPF
ncbi:hypothetical protein [Priestia aryabhattai]